MSVHDSDTGNFIDILNSIVDDREKDYSLEREYEVLSPGDFFLSEYHCGFSREMIPKFWLDEAVDFIEGGYNELIITGSLGSFKTTWANLILLYKTYELFSHKNIHAFLSLPSIQDIYNIYFSVSLTQSRLTGYKQFVAMLDSSKFFKENFPRNDHKSSMVEFPKQPKFSIFSGSGHQHAIGMTVWSFILDEGDFFKKNGAGFDESYEHVTNMYTELVDRRYSRFKTKGNDYSFSILISSASFQSSFVSKRIEEASSDSKAKIIKAINYKVVPDRYRKEKFVVFKGDVMADPELITKIEDFNSVFNKLGLKVSLDVDALKNKYNAKEEVNDKILMKVYNNLSSNLKHYFETPPIDLKDRYVKNLYKALQNFSGVYVAGEGKLLQSKSVLRDNYTDEIIHPFSKERVELSTGDDIQLRNYFLHNLVVYKDRPHAIHVDASVTGDAAGMSMSRYDGVTSVDGVTLRHYSQVFSLEIVPPVAPYRTKLSKLRDFIIYLRDVVGYNIIAVSYDQFQSEESRQLLGDKGFNVFRLSIDKSDETYLSWIQLLQDKCYSMYKYKVLEDEAFAAIHNRRKRKVDHPKNGNININVLQSLVGSLHNLVTFSGLPTNEYDVSLLKQKNDKVSKKELDGDVLKGALPTSNYINDVKELKKKNSIHDIIFNA